MSYLDEPAILVDFKLRFQLIMLIIKHIVLYRKRRRKNKIEGSVSFRFNFSTNV
jgi:hypothetical protein